MLAIYFIAVFPANIHNALNGLTVEGLPQAAWYYWVRLPFQPLAIWWALSARNSSAGHSPLATTSKRKS